MNSIIDKLEKLIIDEFNTAKKENEQIQAPTLQNSYASCNIQGRLLIINKILNFIKENR